jgi:ribonucleoside-diphosphate reductase beta chain
MTPSVRDDILDMCQKTVRIEDAFIDLVFEMGPVNGMTPKDIKKYVRFIADWRLGQLGLKPIYMIEEHPLPWLAPLLNGVEHANFFETRATEYSKGATKGQWTDVWDASTAASRPRSARWWRTRMRARRACSGRAWRRSNQAGRTCLRRSQAQRHLG